MKSWTAGLGLAVALTVSACAARTEEASATSSQRAALAGDPWQRVSTGSELPPPPYEQPAVYDQARAEYVLFSSGAGSTWTWNGTSWRFRGQDGPPARVRTAMTYDAERQRVVLFGGLDPTFTVAFDDLWEWDGTTWTERCTVGCSSKPPSRQWHAMASRGGTTYLLGGVQSDGSTAADELWGWDGTSWQLFASPVPGRVQSTAVFDPTTNYIIVFGGYRPSSGNPVPDTFFLAPNNASFEVVPTVGTNVYGSVYYDATRAQVRMVRNGNSAVELYRLNGQSWVPVATTGAAVPQMSGFSGAYDSARDRFVLTGQGAPELRVYELAGSLWIKPSLSTVAMPARAGAAMAYDLGRRRMVLFGGGLQDTQTAGWSNRLDDTWEWDGSAWTRVPTTTAPTARAGAFMVYHAARQAMILVGGDDGAAGSTEVWQWDGATWTLLPVQWLAGGIHDLVYDRARDRVVAINDSQGIFDWDEVNGYWDNVGGLDAYESFIDVAAPNPGGGIVIFGSGLLGVATETFVWDGINFAAPRVPTLHAPPARYRGRFAYDARQDRALLVGGIDPLQAYPTETWAWDGTDWSIAEPFAGLGRENLAFAFDEDRGNGLLFGGQNNGQLLGDTWRYAVVGMACASDSQCTSGVCADGVCCDRACEGGCEVCSVANGAASDGICMVLEVTQALAGDCGDLLCRGGTECPTGCLSDAECVVSKPYCCQPSEASECTLGQCTPKKHDGIACGDGVECLSGVCNNGVCCEAACGTCARCDTPGFLGQCRAVEAGQSEPATCASPKICDVSRNCGLPNGTVSAMPSDCLSGKIADGVCCNVDCTGDCQSCATGTCEARAVGDGGRANACLTREVSGVPKPTSCDGTNPSCRASCASDAECITGYICCTATTAGCSTAQVGSCTPQVGLGSTCDEDADCVSGHCVGNICCNTSCDSHVCLACDLPGSVGVCSARAGAFAGCGGSGVCMGECIGAVTAPACVFAGSDRSCATCAVCDGRGECSAMPPTGRDDACPTQNVDCGDVGECLVATAPETKSCRSVSVCRQVTAADCVLAQVADDTPCTGGVCKSGACKTATPPTTIGGGCAVTGDGAVGDLMLVWMLCAALYARALSRARWSASRSSSRRCAGASRD